MSEHPDGPAAAARVVLVTAPSKEVGLSLARELVGGRLAACVNVLDGATSVYRWEGAVAEDEECLLVVKTSADRIEELHELLEAQHPYDTPEAIALQPASVERRFLDWLLGASAPGEPDSDGPDSGGEVA